MFWRQVLGLVLAFPGVLADSRSRWANKDTFGMATLMVGVGKPGRQGGRPGCVQPRGRTVQQGCGLPEPPPSSSEYLTDFVPPTSLFRVLPAFGGFLEVAQWSPAASRFLLPPAMTHRILLLTGAPGEGRGWGELRVRRREISEFVNGEKGSRIFRSWTGKRQKGLGESYGMTREAWLNDNS